MNLQLVRRCPWEATQVSEGTASAQGVFWWIEAAFAAPLDPESGMTVNLRDVDMWLHALVKTRAVIREGETLEFFARDLKSRIRRSDVRLMRLTLWDGSFATEWRAGESQAHYIGLFDLQRHDILDVRRPFRGCARWRGDFSLAASAKQVWQKWSLGASELADPGPPERWPALPKGLTWVDFALIRPDRSEETRWSFAGS